MKRKGTREISGVTPFPRLRYGKSAPSFPVPCKIARCPVQYYRFRIYFPFAVFGTTIMSAPRRFPMFPDRSEGSRLPWIRQNDKGKEKVSTRRAAVRSGLRDRFLQGSRLRSMGGLFLHDAAPEKKSPNAAAIINTPMTSTKGSMTVWQCIWFSCKDE